MQLAPIFIFVLPVLTTIMVGLLGRTRRIGFWGAIFFSVVITPLGGFILTLLSGAKRIEDPALKLSEKTQKR